MGTFLAKIGTIKDRNGMDLKEAEDIKKSWQEYTEELYRNDRDPNRNRREQMKELSKKDLNESDNHDGMVSYPEPDILECEVKWALGSITTNKASGGDGILVDLFQILMML